MDNRDMNESTGVCEDTRFRNHFTYIFEEAWKTIVAFAAFFLLSDIMTEIIMEIQAGRWTMVLIILAVVIVVFALIFLFFVNLLMLLVTYRHIFSFSSKVLNLFVKSLP